MRHRRFTAGILGATLAALLGACGSGTDDSGDRAQAAKKAPTQVLRLTVKPSPGKIIFDKTRLRARPGKVAIELRNPTRLNHNVRIATGTKCCFRPGSKDIGGTNTTGPGTIRGVVKLRPGTYVFYCAVGGHWQLGQHGKLVVQ